ncbi:MAG TPA: shikimate dehydrogenase [Mesorhizobium sp.]|jgi:shikimate dehydrogenase|nr:shikimate dehydrogenase [Mesorhizobium sp.]
MREAFVCGHPIKHSRSPLIHGFWLKQHGIEGRYRAHDVPPAAFSDFLDKVRRGELLGGNVTIPHKEAAFRLVDSRDAAAQAIGAVNTVWCEGGKLVGGNTDAYGFAANLDELVPGWAAGGGQALVLGAGGAARAVLHAVLQRGFERVRLANRTLSRAEELAAHFGPKVEAVGWEALERHLGDTILLVNTTALGMGGEEIALSWDRLPEGATVTDIVYVPLETPFLRAAKERGGLRAADGLGMLLHQAAPGFERWWGVRPRVTAGLRALIMADLEEKAPAA